ncbi:aldo/keto reductase [Cellulomonas xiejunii]|uniref:Aldo/keto reductase n=1 Tax=Cellulomonas xiejunii TaxID=2968083 RepID=A0ABY5KS32_9CELL|nr:aldo/keto reductase [Cellulomonas xiejunii]MCC2322213.1 aldo/keto reductase [Cellulomonas xiejunii]UUI72266.1 aldo/keto reductase [Cellulomonas xiejunii]
MDITQRAPSPVLGTMYFGTRADEALSTDLLDAFVDLGGRWIDTANCYSFWEDPSGVGGQSESLLGRWFAARPGVRERVRLATKVRHQPLVPHEWPSSSEGLSADAIARGFAASLDRLGLDAVDLLWAHAEDRDVPLAETVEAFGALVTAGQVGRLGASNHAAWRVEQARAIARERGAEPWSAVQLRYSYVRPRPGVTLPEGGHVHAERDQLDHARTEGLDVWAYSPLLTGAYVRDDRPLSEGYDHPGTHRRLAVLAEVADGLGATRNQVVLAWLLAQGISPILGVSSLDQLTEAMAARDLALPDEVRACLDAAV